VNDTARLHATSPAGEPAVRESRFARLLPAADWARLPAPIRRRFGAPLAAAATVLYVGEVAATTVSVAGRTFGQLARLVGAPLPLSSGGRAAACVVVMPDGAGGDQRWTRIYARPGRVPQVIHSTKRFAGPTGLEECVGAGVGMSLQLAVEHRTLVFRSTGFFVRIGAASIRIPAWLTPGVIEVRHREERGGTFSFTLTVVHPWFGVIVHQTAFFEDRPAVTPAAT
jgi:hypothetical protein